MTKVAIYHSAYTTLFKKGFSLYQCIYGLSVETCQAYLSQPETYFKTTRPARAYLSQPESYFKTTRPEPDNIFSLTRNSIQTRQTKTNKEKKIIDSTPDHNSTHFNPKSTRTRHVKILILILMQLRKNNLSLTLIYRLCKKEELIYIHS